MGLLFQLVLIGAPIELLAALLIRPGAVPGSTLSRAQRATGALAILAAVIPGVWFFASGSFRGESIPWMIVLLSIPILATLAPALTPLRFRTIGIAGGALAMAAFCLIGAMSIGILYLPAAAFLLIAGIIGLIPQFPR